MSEFLKENFLLPTSAAQKLYHEYAKGLPIVDYHCHVSPKEIWEDKRFENLAQVWLSGDHYKWRLMRANGVSEEYVTGDADDWEKFQKFAELLPKAIGNPMYHWCHLELKNYFGYTGLLSKETAKEVWELTKEKLQSPDLSVRGMIRRSNVAFIGTTDDPADSLEYHEKLQNDPMLSTIVAPSFRPDKALQIEKDGWREYLSRFSEAVGISIDGIDSLEEALSKRIEYFDKHGCRASDHGLDKAVFAAAERSQVDRIIKKRLSGETVTSAEADAVKTSLLLFLAGEYEKRGWVMQIHYNCMRNPNSLMFEKAGPDTGFDCIGPNNGSEALRQLLDAMYRSGRQPRTVLYSLDSNDNAFLDALVGSFQDGKTPGKLQHGSAWWYNDTKDGMLSQMTGLASTGLLGNFIGMLTDSRSFLSYARHEYFRRSLCGLLGGWMESGEYPEDYEMMGKLVQDVCYYNAVRYFGLEEKLGLEECL